CRIYASVPDSSADIAKKIVVHDYNHDQTSLYDISQRKFHNEKGFFEVEVENRQINIINNNPGFATAPIAVWVVRRDCDNYSHSVVFDAANIDTAPNLQRVVAIMSTDPFI
ncbi:hypothetical protein PENTCL1PPCAC_21179, partial [Pristionchus entomophagus]